MLSNCGRVARLWSSLSGLAQRVGDKFMWIEITAIVPSKTKTDRGIVATLLKL